ncbi:MAG TPA: sulfotransferase [Nitrospirota bacterium]|nr:sulfotransferase [Nitrospirota bacterium]
MVSQREVLQPPQGGHLQENEKQDPWGLRDISSSGFIVRLKLICQSLFSQQKWDLIRVFKWVENEVMQKHFEGVVTNKKFVINKYLKHIEDVKSALPSERLLIYNVGSGWDPLCQFLDVARPLNIPFPHLNKRSEFPEMIKKIHVEIVFQVLQKPHGYLDFLINL